MTPLEPVMPAALAVLDFTFIDTPTSEALSAERKCSLCGEVMNYWVGFLGGPKAAERLAYTDPPGHVECLSASVVLCPHIAIERHRRANDRPGGGGGVVPEGFSDGKPAYWVLGITARYRAVVQRPSGIVVYVVPGFKGRRFFVYGPDGRIVATDTDPASAGTRAAGDSGAEAKS